MADFLLELLSEEIPARMQDKAAADLARLFEAELHKADVFVGPLETFVTPRRLALIARKLPDQTEAVSIEIKGPRTSAPEQALEGFLRKNGLTRDQLVDRDGILFADLKRPGRPMVDVLAEATPAIVRAFPWPKAMRWGAASAASESLRWVRPLQGIVALFGEEIVPFEIAGVESGAATVGHRFHHPGVITIGSAADYAEKLRACHVIVDSEERRRIVREGAEQAAADAGLVLVPDEGLVAENAGLTEWPVPLLGRFDPKYLTVPREVIQLTMRTNQKYFACNDAERRLAPAFVCTANIVPADEGAAIVAGNAKVLAARLSDARFFWEQDLKVPLEARLDKLKDIVFHEKLGTVADKVERVAKLARWLVEEGIVGIGSNPVPSSSVTPAQAGVHKHGVGASFESSATMDSRLRGNDGEIKALADMAEQAARLAKADLVTGMVGEFPELQGVMGGYYARAEGLPDAVADAIRDHYKPVGQGDEVPTAPVTVAVSLADKLDTIAAFFSINEKPTGSKDPFALRRAVLGIIRILTHNDLDASLRKGFELAMELNHRGRRGRDQTLERDGGYSRYIDELIAFAVDRLKVQQREAGVRHDLIDAVFALGGEDDLVRLLARVKALQAFVETEDGRNLLAGYRRAANILRAEAKKGTEAAGFSGFSYAPDPAEAALAEALDRQLPLAEQAIAAEDFSGAMTALSNIRQPIDAFFDDVTVNDADETKRLTRLALLDKLRAAMHNVADFSKIEG